MQPEYLIHRPPESKLSRLSSRHSAKTTKYIMAGTFIKWLFFWHTPNQIVEAFMLNHVSGNITNRYAQYAFCLLSLKMKKIINIYEKQNIFVYHFTL